MKRQQQDQLKGERTHPPIPHPHTHTQRKVTLTRTNPSIQAKGGNARGSPADTVQSHAKGDRGRYLLNDIIRIYLIIQHDPESLSYLGSARMQSQTRAPTPQRHGPSLPLYPTRPSGNTCTQSPLASWQAAVIMMGCSTPPPRSIGSVFPLRKNVLRCSQTKGHTESRPINLFATTRRQRLPDQEQRPALLPD